MQGRVNGTASRLPLKSSSVVIDKAGSSIDQGSSSRDHIMLRDDGNVDDQGAWC